MRFSIGGASVGVKRSEHPNPRRSNTVRRENLANWCRKRASAGCSQFSSIAENLPHETGQSFVGTAFTQAPPAEVQCDGIQPGGEDSLAPERRQMVKGVQKGVLGDLVRLGRVVQNR